MTQIGAEFLELPLQRERIQKTRRLSVEENKENFIIINFQNLGE